jgi:putative FmdB family regulatory protein
MPTYVYECKECAKQTELIQKITEPPLDLCPDCGGNVRKMIFPVGIVFKGSGFYVNDYKNKDTKSREEKPKAASSEALASAASATATTSSPAEAKPSESKPAT